MHIVGQFYPCDECDKPFRAEFPTQRLCWSCWRQLKAENNYAEGFAKGYVIGQEDKFTIEGSFLKDLLKLCHPDMHPPERAELANRVTRTLLDMRPE